MTEFITYHTTYTEFLIPLTDYKVVVHNDGSGHVENMMHKDRGIVFSNGNTDSLCDELAEADRKFKALELDYCDKVNELYTIIANKDADIEALYAELENLKSYYIVKAMNAIFDTVEKAITD